MVNVGVFQCQEVQLFKLKEEIEETAVRLMFLLDYAKFPRKPHWQKVKFAVCPGFCFKAKGWFLPLWCCPWTSEVSN